MKKTVSEEIKPKRKRSKGYSRVKGHSYEVRIAKELRELGFTGIVTSRSESKRADDNKQEKKEINICSVGEAVIMDKKLFYKLIKKYYL